MSFMWTVAAVFIALVVVRITRWLYRWSNPGRNCIGKLPPGSMGFPIIGETIEFFKPYGFYEFPPFFKERLSRYGPMFRTNILGTNTVFMTDPDVISEVFRQENKAFMLSYPDVFVKVFGKNNLFFKPGNIHKYIREISQHLLGVGNLKGKMIRNMVQETNKLLTLKAGEAKFDIRDAVSQLVLASITPMVISNLEPETLSNFVDQFKSLNHDWFRSPFAPSTWKAFFRVRKASKEANKVIRDVLTRRKELKEKHGDFLDTVLEELEKENTVLDTESAISLIFNLFFTAKESVSYSTAIAIKFISENPKVLAELKTEHEAILQNKEDKESGVSWEEYRQNMSFTNMVINESLRIANLAPALFRKALRDVEIKEYTIPAGWIVAVVPALLHYDSQIYENPFEFNLWRWEGKEMIWGSKTFMVFGGGVRLCVGTEFARLQIALFLHHLVTTYDFSLVQECELVRKPFAHFSKSLLVNISKSSK